MIPNRRVIYRCPVCGSEKLHEGQPAAWYCAHGDTDPDAPTQAMDRTVWVPVAELDAARADRDRARARIAHLEEFVAGLAHAGERRRRYRNEWGAR